MVSFRGQRNLEPHPDWSSSGLNLNSCPFHIEVPLWDCWIMKCMYNNIDNHNVLFDSLGAVAIKTLNVSEPSPQQLQGFKNEVAVLR